MHTAVINMETVLNNEKLIYDEILHLEKVKTGAIAGRDGDALESSTRQQEQLLEKVEKLEKDRQKIVNRYVKANHLDDLGKDITLKDILHSMDEDSARHLMRIAMELKARLIELKAVKDANEIMLHDNMEFYNILLSGLKKGTALDSAYGSDGKEDGGVKTQNPLLFNQTA